MASSVAKNWDSRSTFLGVEVGPFRRRFEQGWIPPECGDVNECTRLSFCCVTGIHPLQIPWITPSGPKETFWEHYEQLAEICGFKWEERIAWTAPEGLLRGPWPFTDAELWIAGVGTCGGRGYGDPHAIVMKGQQLYYDCNTASPRVRRPTRICWGVKLNPLI